MSDLINPYGPKKLLVSCPLIWLTKMNNQSHFGHQILNYFGRIIIVKYTYETPQLVKTQLASLYMVGQQIFKQSSVSLHKNRNLQGLGPLLVRNALQKIDRNLRGVSVLHFF